MTAPRALPQGLEDRTFGHNAPIVAKILVADDEPRNLLAVSEILAGPGIDLVLVESGEEVLRRTLREDFAVILLDVRMPRIDGYEVASLLRARHRSSHVPILFLTAYNKEDLHVFRGYSAGAVDYVFKPIEPLILRSKVHVFVDLYRKTEEIKRQHAAEKELLLENLRVRGEKLNVEQALRRGEEHQSLVLRGLPVALYTAALEPLGRRLHFTSDNVERISGYPQTAFEQAGFWESCLNADDFDRVTDQLRGIEETGAVTVEYRLLCSDGTERHILDRAVLIRGEDDVAREIFGMWFDVSDRKELERRLLHASKLEAVGRLTGGIAHDFNNMLSVVMGSLDLLRRNLNGNDKAIFYVESAVQGAQRCAELTNRLLAFSRRSPLRATVLRLAEVMPGLVELLQRTLGERIDVQLALTDELSAIRVDPSQFEAALVNLAVNARDAMPEGGVLRVEVRPSAADHLHVESGDRFVEISVADTGTGIAPEILERVFEPFFTTKESGKGTGLGLSMVYGFVQQSGGDVQIDSAAGHGTTIRLTFPVPADRAVDAEEPGTAAPEPVSGGGETILVVEDEAAVRGVTTATLESLGFVVVQAESGEQALAVLEVNPGIKLIFSDVRMPGRLTGIELERLVKAQRPDIAFLLTSGFVEEDQDLSGCAFLQKPYRAAELADKLRSLLHAASMPGA